MKRLKVGKTGLKRPVAKKGKRARTKRQQKALAIWLSNPTISKEAAAQAAGYKPGQGARVLSADSLPRQILSAMGEQCGVTDKELAENITTMLRANTLDKEALQLPRLNPAQMELFEKNWFDAFGNPKTGAPGVRPDLTMREKALRLTLEISKAGVDLDYGKKMYERGQQESNTYWLGLIQNLQLTPEQQAVLDGEAAQAKQGEEGKG